jgi:hypothetical protein
MMIQTFKSVVSTWGRPRRRAHAHTGTHSYAIVEIDGSVVGGTVQFPIDVLNDVLSLSLPLDEVGATAAIEQNRDAIYAYIDEHFSLRSGAQVWPVALQGWRVLERSRFSYAIFSYHIAPPLGELPGSFTLVYDGVVDSRPDHEGMAIVRQHAGIGKFRSKTEQRWPVQTGATSFQATVRPDSMRTNLSGAVQHVSEFGREYFRRARKRMRKDS